MGLSPEQINSIMGRDIAIKQLMGTAAERLFRRRLDLRKTESAEAKAERERLINIQKGRETEIDIETKQLGLGQERRQEDIIKRSKLFHDPNIADDTKLYLESQGDILSEDQLERAIAGETIFKDPSLRLLQDPAGDLVEIPKGGAIPPGFTTPTETIRDMRVKSEEKARAFFNTTKYLDDVTKRVLAEDRMLALDVGPEATRKRDIAIAKMIASDMRASGIPELRGATWREHPPQSGILYIVNEEGVVLKEF